MVERFLKIIFNTWVGFVFISLTNIFPQNEFKDETSRQIINQDQIKLSGISRLSDLFSLFNEWHSTTIDGYRWNIYSTKTPFDQNQNWILMLNGQRIDLNFFGEKNINFLPISSHNIDSITIYSSPELLNGEFSSNGIININTLKPLNGFSFYSEVFTGNESGDPGPYKYIDEYYSENIDIIGPDYSFGLEYGSDIINATMNYKTNAYIYPSADSPVYYRVENYGFKYRKVFMDAFSTTFDFPTLPSKPNIIAGYSGTGKYNIFSRYGSDLIFYDPLFCEVPADNKFTHIGLSGSFGIANTSFLNYSAKWSSTKTKNPAEHNDYLIDWRMDNFYFNTEFLSMNKNFNYTLGAGFTQNLAKTFYSLRNNKTYLYKIYTSVNTSISDNTDQSIDLMIVRNENRQAFKSILTNFVHFGRSNSFEVKLSYTEQLAEEEYSLSNWVSNGFIIPCGCNLANKSISGKNTNIFGEAIWTFNLDKKINSKLGVFHNRVLNKNYEIIEIFFNENNNTIQSNRFMSNNIDGSNFGLLFSTDHEIASNISHKLHYTYSSPITSDRIYSDIWNTLSKHKLYYNLSYFNGNDFGIHFAATFLSSSVWKNFTEIEKQSGGLYKSRQKEKILCDVSLLKYFWQKRLKINMIFKNLLNQENRHSPLGARFDFSFFFLLEIALK